MEAHIGRGRQFKTIAEINGKEVSTVPLSSYVRALEIANILKEWIKNGEFFLTEPQFMLPTVTKR